MDMSHTNWAGNYTYQAAHVHYPETVEQVQALVRRSRKPKALGSRHSFNALADTPDDLISLKQFERVIELDHEHRTVTVDGGITYGQLCSHLHHAGYAVHNLASLPHISVAGACATATHGSGERHGNLATAVRAITFVAADGALIELSRDQHGDMFGGAVVGLGGLGIITKLTLDIEPAFEMRQTVYEQLPLSVLEEHFDDILSCAYSVSLFTDWRAATIDQVWVKQRITDGDAVTVVPELYGAIAAPTHLHPIKALPAINCTAQMGIPGPWYDRLPHFRMDFTPSSGEELQTEYLIPRHHALAALHALDRIRDRVAPLVQISEIRTIAADTLWMSPCYEQACVGLHFTWHKDWPAVKHLLPLIEEQLAPLQARPHWGKLFMMPPERVQMLYARLPDFQALLRTYDPQGKFRNAFLNTYIFNS